MDQFQNFKINNLIESGHSQAAAVDALNICDWDLTQARNYLKAQGNTGKEEQDELSRAIEMDFLSDLEPLTLENRLREENIPVGLKNIGNTCYLNSFIQALYHLPPVMIKIMSLNETTELQRQSSLNARKRIESSYHMVVELKKLFAYMTKSEQKYADPTAMIRNVVDDFGNQLKIGDQQDISEVSEGFMTRIHEGIREIIHKYSY